MERIKSGIRGLDELLNGGIPRGYSILVTGQTGAGKTLFSLEFIYRGAKNYSERGIFVSTDEDVERLKLHAKGIGLDFEKLERKNLVKIVSLRSMEEFFTRIPKLIQELKPRRLVIDSLTTLWEFITPWEVEFKGILKERIKSLPVQLTEVMLKKKVIFDIINMARSWKCTTLLTSELPERGEWLSRDTVSEFLCDGIIVLRYLEYAAGGVPRSISIRKMRGTQHATEIFPFEITKQGIVIKKD
ncbi:MAG: ATPase domain-containing protein [Candidatus Aenigmarchaeota archaeon]|nr:ATPase domain-containing protein [Candidatus Aenigmarchaeota archaeon]